MAIKSSPIRLNLISSQRVYHSEMANTDLEFFMETLKQLIYNDMNNPLIGSNRFIKSRIPEIKLLYEELGNLIGSGIMSMDDEQLRLHELHGYVGNWKKRAVDIAHKAEDIVDLFISSAILKEKKIIRPEILLGSDRFLTHNLKDVMDGIKSIRKELKAQTVHLMNNKNKKDMTQAAGTSSTRNTARLVTEHEEVMVGLDEQALSIMDRLAADRKQLDIISIVGMGGLGKTTLATKLFNDRYIAYYFHVRGWVTVSQTYTNRDLLKGVLESIDKSVPKATTEPILREMLYKSLKGMRYLVVIDDIWSPDAWDDLRQCLPDDNTGSRVLLTTRLTEVASHASPGGFTHNLRCLTKEESFELLCRKAFRGNQCPESLIETGKEIARKCRGLPLALVVIAGLLEKGEKKKDVWENVAKSVSSYVVNDPNGCLDTLALSYDHLPRRLRNCFLYVGGFPEDYNIQVKRLIRLWMAEGFIREAGKRSLEEEAEDYLMDLVDRNLLIVAHRRSNGAIKSCRLHDLLRELCLKKGNEENFFKKVGRSDSFPVSDSNSSIEEQRCLFTDYEVLSRIHSLGSLTHIRSVLCFYYRRRIKDWPGLWLPLIDVETCIWVCSFLHLKVLDILNCLVEDLSEIKLLTHLRYLAVWGKNQYLSPVVDNLWRLQTLLVKGGNPHSFINGDMVNLRHLWSDGLISYNSGCPVLFNLQSISRLRLYEGLLILRSFPHIKKLACAVSSKVGYHESLNFAILTHLEALDIENFMFVPLLLKHPIRFPGTLKRLTLKGLHLPWSCMSTIQQLPNLEVLKLLDYSFKGRLWSTGDEQFRQLKFLKLHKLEIELWETSSINFPCLRKLVIGTCKNLKEIPLEIGDISTLECIEIDGSNLCLRESINRIQEEQHALGNDDIHVNFSYFKTQSAQVFFNGDPFFY